MIKKLLFSCLLLGTVTCAKAQMKWLTFPELDSAMKVEQRPVLVEFYTDWCTYCKKMDKEVFVKRNVFRKIESDFYAVKFDAEFKGDVLFDGLTFSKTDKPYHDLTYLLASNNGEFTPPVLLFFDSEFSLKEKITRYVPTKEMLKKLDQYSSN